MHDRDDIMDSDQTQARPRGIPKRRYTIPVRGKVTIPDLAPLIIDDLQFKFVVAEGLLSSIVITFPEPPPPKDISTLPNLAGGNDELRIWDPRAEEIRDLVQRIAIGLSTTYHTRLDLLFDARMIESVRNENGREVVSSMKLQLASGAYEAKPVKLPFKFFAREIVAAQIFRYDSTPSTFFKRGAADCLSHRYIEAFYNFYFIIEYLFGDGKFREDDLVAAYLRSSPLVDAVQNVLKERPFAAILRRDSTERFASMTEKQFLRHIVRLRGRMLHANRSGSRRWHPERPGIVANEAIILHQVCARLIIAEHVCRILSEPVMKCVKKVERCIRVGNPVRLVTRLSGDNWIFRW
ncbi:MAG: hypothetical protein R3F45_05305 [Gammaproteobacteria bacterium]